MMPLDKPRNCRSLEWTVNTNESQKKKVDKVGSGLYLRWNFYRFRNRLRLGRCGDEKRFRKIQLVVTGKQKRRPVMY